MASASLRFVGGCCRARRSAVAVSIRLICERTSSWRRHRYVSSFEGSVWLTAYLCQRPCQRDPRCRPRAATSHRSLPSTSSHHRLDRRAVTRPHRFPSLRHRHRDSTCRPPACRLRRDTAHNPCASCSASQPAAHHSRCVVAPPPLRHRSWFVLWPTARTRSHVVAIAYASSRTLRRSSSSFIGCTSLLV